MDRLVLTMTSGKRPGDDPSMESFANDDFEHGRGQPNSIGRRRLGPEQSTCAPVAHEGDIAARDSQIRDELAP